MTSNNKLNDPNFKKLVPGKKDFWFLPLGGSNEIGMNLNLFGHNKQWLIVDLGITFNDRLGIEILAPDPSFLIAHKDAIAGLVVTHAHEDHIGAIPYLWPYLRCPIYATPFTMLLIRQKIMEYHWKDDVELIEMPLSSTFTVGDFEIEYVSLTHSILEPNALRISTPIGTVLHSGDWKIDPTPLVGETTNINRLCEIGQEGVLALLCDSTNVFYEGSAGSEYDVQIELEKVLKECTTERITVACFASNLARVATIAKIADSLGRKVALLGRSLHKMVAAAKSCGYLLDLPEFITDAQAMKMKGKKVCFIATGSQGESKAALARIASGSHPMVEYNDNDVVIFSSRMIPGNEKNISALQNSFIHQGIRIITSGEESIHVSGHPARDELRQMYEWIKPEVLIPVHGDARHLDEHAKFALECGISSVVVPENGSVINLAKNNTDEIDFIPVGRWAYDGNRMIPWTSPLLKERQKLSTEGSAFITLHINAAREIIQKPHMSFKGLCSTPEEHDLCEEEVYMSLKNILDRDFKSHEECTIVMEQVARKTIHKILGKKPFTVIHTVRVKK